MKNQIQSEWETLTLIEKMFFDLNGKNLMKSTNSIINNFDNIHPISCNIIISQILYTLCATNIYDFDMCLNFLKEIEALEASKKVNPSFFEIFTDILIKKNTQESFYLLENLVEHNFIQPNFIQTVKNPYFAHYMSKREIKKLEYFDFKDQILDNYEELSKNDWELHKQLIKEGHNPNEISKIIRNDEIEKLQEISSQNDFNFNQIIPKSLYERCSIINENYKIVRLIDYAAFFGSIKCFKYLLVNGADLKDTGKFSVAGGNEEIIHLCKQNHISFQGSIKIAIKFHKNDIFKYLYENNNKRFKNLTDLGKECILYHNYEIFTFLLENGMKINDDIINEATRNGNLYLVKYFHKEYPRLPNNILLISSETRNIELVKYILEQNEIDVSTKNVLIVSFKVYFCKLIFHINNWNLLMLYCTSFLLACKYGFNEMVEILIKINGIDIHVKDIYIFCLILV